MMNSAGTQWFAVQARPCGEMAAQASLRSLSIETLLPMVRRPIRHATRSVRFVARALFPGYLFARFCPVNLLRAVSYSRGVVRVVRAGEDPLPVDDGVITSIRERVGADGCVELVEDRLGANDRVRITSGPLAGWAGVFERELSDEQRVVILIETLQQCRVVVSREFLEFADAA